MLDRCRARAWLARAFISGLVCPRLYLYIYMDRHFCFCFIRARTRRHSSGSNRRRRGSRDVASRRAMRCALFLIIARARSRDEESRRYQRRAVGWRERERNISTSLHVSHPLRRAELPQREEEVGRGFHTYYATVIVIIGGAKQRQARNIECQRPPAHRTRRPNGLHQTNRDSSSAADPAPHVYLPRPPPPEARHGRC